MNTLRAGTPLHAAGVLLVLVERIWLHPQSRDDALWACGGREPVAVVIRDANGTHAVDIQGDDVALDTLLNTTSGLAELLNPEPD